MEICKYFHMFFTQLLLLICMKNCAVSFNQKFILQVELGSLYTLNSAVNLYFLLHVCVNFRINHFNAYRNKGRRNVLVSQSHLVIGPPLQRYLWKAVAAVLLPFASEAPQSQDLLLILTGHRWITELQAAVYTSDPQEGLCSPLRSCWAWEVDHQLEPQTLPTVHSISESRLQRHYFTGWEETLKISVTYNTKTRS